ncbi:hypothetical protein BDP81DRAFT_390193 [Colletotrichum phormii]|uniref:Uncharacterized protein n=1 Tax=Colletotrichum phormii TaxID=359342 RepID=A0AAJ0ELF2_9PEZI|nr:uncharacterized protein BDP81DRAFT_390193 [Colletotrichum phormii]KAK1640855.1 hypothetical protein BDP81DRAFT_390193 [Colletotrichum phormii]
MRNSTRVTERCVVPDIAARELLYWDYNSMDSGGGHTMAKCSMTTSFIGVRVSCSGWDCEATAIRLTALAPGESRRTNITFFDSCPKEEESLWNWFFQCFSTLTDNGSGGVGVTTILQSYLVDPNLGLNSTAARNLPPVYTIGKELFSVRLGQILNTYWLAMIGNEPLFLGHPENYDGVTTWSPGSGDALSYDNYVFSKSEANVYVRVQVLRYDKAWMAVLIASTLVLLLTTILDFALNLKIWVPKLLMNTSTLTRGNPNFEVPVGGGALSDEARARLLADVKVRFGDSEGVDDSHDLIIGNCVEYGGRVSKLTKRKLYA